MREKIIDSIGRIDNDMIESVDALRQKKRIGPAWLKWGSLVACFFAILLAGKFMLQTANTQHVSFGGITREYKKDSNITVGNSAIVWPWDTMTISEQYTTLTLNGKEFVSRGRSVDSSLLDKAIGTYDVVGYDAYSEQEHRMKANVYRIAGIDEDRMVAVKLEDSFYVFKHDEYHPPKNFGEILDNYSLAQYLHFDRFSVYEGYTEKGYYSLVDDTPVWEVLSQCPSAPFVEDDSWDRNDRNYISFTATSDALGVYKNVFYVTDDGFIWTNIFDYAYIFQIGEETANKVISYVTKNGVESKSEPYTYSVAGTVTEITESYILVDDSILCANEKDGMIFKIPTNDLRISRCINYGKIDVGDIVAVNFTGNIDIEAGNVVEGAFALSKATISGDGVSTAE